MKIEVKRKPATKAVKDSIRLSVFFPGTGNSGGRTWVGLEKLQAEL